MTAIRRKALVKWILSFTVNSVSTSKTAGYIRLEKHSYSSLRFLRDLHAFLENSYLFVSPYTVYFLEHLQPQCFRLIFSWKSRVKDDKPKYKVLTKEGTSAMRNDIRGKRNNSLSFDNVQESLVTKEKARFEIRRYRLQCRSLGGDDIKDIISRGKQIINSRWTRSTRWLHIRKPKTSLDVRISVNLTRALGGQSTLHRVKGVSERARWVREWERIRNGWTMREWVYSYTYTDIYIFDKNLLKSARQKKARGVRSRCSWSSRRASGLLIRAFDRNFPRKFSQISNYPRRSRFAAATSRHLSSIAI